MADPKRPQRGLGRGLSALMADVDVTTSSNTTSGNEAGVRTIPIERIEPNPDQPRKRFAPDDLADLAASIQEKGVLQPLLVRQMGDRFQIVAGERRWRAAQQAQVHELPVVVREFTDVEVLEVAIIENIQRADLNPMEEAQGYKQLMDRFGHTQERLSDALGKSRSHIANLLRLMSLPVAVQDMVRDGSLSMGHARALVTSDNALALAKQIVAKGLSVRDVEKLMKRGPNDVTRAVPRAADAKDADTKALEGDLSASLGMKVYINHADGGESGQVVVDYKTLDELDDLCRRLSGQ